MQSTTLEPEKEAIQFVGDHTTKLHMSALFGSGAMARGYISESQYTLHRDGADMPIVHVPQG